MKIELREKIQTTQKEFESVNQNDRPRLSDTLFDKPKHSRASYNPDTKSFEEVMESTQ